MEKPELEFVICIIFIHMHARAHTHVYLYIEEVTESYENYVSIIKLLQP